MPFSSRNSNGSDTFANRFVQYGLICRYSIFFVPAMISANHSRSMVVVIRSYGSFFIRSRGAARVATNPEKRSVGVLAGVPATVHIQVMGRVSTFRECPSGRKWPRR
jgi:hypothetical protein